MEYNKEKIDRFIRMLNMQEEIKRLIEAGLSYGQLTGVLYNVFNPDYLRENLDLFQQGISDCF